MKKQLEEAKAKRLSVIQKLKYHALHEPDSLKEIQSLTKQKLNLDLRITALNALFGDE